MNLPRAFFKTFWLPFYRAFSLRHIRKTRQWRSHGLDLSIPPGVFHPGIFFSTPIFLDFLSSVDLQGKTTLDVGTGSGALALHAAQKGALTTAIDINPLAVQTARENARQMHLTLTCLESNLFQGLSPARFDRILVNPPYYKKQADNLTENAFFAGENLEYFQRFFAESKPFLSQNGTIWMILSEDCDWDFITAEARKNGFTSAVPYERRHWGERIFVGQFTLTNDWVISPTAPA
jgi:release factor glutamine methyltransferase